MAEVNQVRGSLRSGKRFAAKNQPYYLSVRDLLAHHPRLLAQEPAVATRFLRIADNRQGSLIRTTVRFRPDYSGIEHKLREVFLDLFREHSENSSDGFEVVITFNAILTNSARTSFSVFFGQDFGFENVTGRASQLSYSDPVIVRSLPDLSLIPTSIDLESVIAGHKRSFESSDVQIERILNIVYLIRRFVLADPAKSRTSRVSRNESETEERGTRPKKIFRSPPARAYEGGKNFDL